MCELFNNDFINVQYILKSGKPADLLTKPPVTCALETFLGIPTLT